MARPFRHPELVRQRTQSARPRAGKTARAREMPLESTIERYLVQVCNERSFLCWKFTSPARSGVPDRVIISPAGTVFVEVKRPGGTLRAKQQVVVASMRRAGAAVYTLTSTADVDELIDHLWRSSKDMCVHRLHELQDTASNAAPTARHARKPIVHERIPE